MKLRFSAYPILWQRFTTMFTLSELVDLILLFAFLIWVECRISFQIALPRKFRLESKQIIFSLLQPASFIYLIGLTC